MYIQPSHLHHQLLLALNSKEKGKDLQYLMELSPVTGVGLGTQTRLSRRWSRCVCQQAKGVTVENSPGL